MNGFTKKYLWRVAFIFASIVPSQGDICIYVADQSVNSSQVNHKSYDQAGNYAKALEAAQIQYSCACEPDHVQDAARHARMISRFEKKLLLLGSFQLLFDANFRPKVKLMQLLSILGMPALDPDENALNQINSWAQKNLLRQGERWQEQNHRFEELTPRLKPLLKELDFVKATVPHFKEYQGALIHGAMLPTARLRLHYLIKQWKCGIRFSHLYFLSGDRPLQAEHENEETLLSDQKSPLKIREEWSRPHQLPKTEAEMMRFIWEQSEIPEDVRKQVKVHFIHAPMKKNPGSEKSLRPTTDDTVEYWLKNSPPLGRYLAVSNSPYINRQDLVVRMMASKGYEFETIGPEAIEQEKMAIFLDELARFIYQTKIVASR